MKPAESASNNVKFSRAVNSLVRFWSEDIVLIDLHPVKFMVQNISNYHMI